jgi:hypothetical protein
MKYWNAQAANNRDVSAETAVIQIVEQTKRRSGWRVYRTLAALGLPRSVYCAWKSSESLQDRTAKPCWVYYSLLFVEGPPRR